MSSDFNFDVRSRDEAEQEVMSGRGKTSRYEPVAQKWVEIEDDEAIVLSDLSMNDVQNIRNLMYNRFGKENVIVRSAKDGEIDGETAYKAVVRQREGDEFLRNGESSDTTSDDNPFDDLEGDSEMDATSAAVDLALEHGINLDDVEGTGSDGCILKSDVQEHVG
jgi:pyruvate/2-oxoglutarate dehydrogenase complex dihydrolipoamide acyltransferase (E2) component